MKKHSNRRTIMSFIIITLLLVSTVITCFGATLSTNVKYVTAYGNINYSYYNSVTGSTTVAPYATVYVRCEDNRNVPRGYMGGQARVFYESGQLGKTSGWQYNASELRGVQWDSPSFDMDGEFYADSLARFKNGEEDTVYKTVETGMTGFVQHGNNRRLLSASEISDKIMNKIEPYAINANNQTYGSALYAKVCGEAPDLISVLTEDGIEGYIYDSDLNSEPTSVEEAFVLSQISEVPIYAADGITVLGTFAIN